ncbi:MAG: NUDIX domain-containing protein [Firmicutes bacterium]|nr:NUDIX domain-containing protein [Bacillota bacterium]
MDRIRVSIKAVIIEGEKILVTKNHDSWGFFYLLPGGGQNPGETVEAALKRECCEEIGTEVEVGELLYVRDYIAAHHEFAEWDGDTHQLELMFSCRLTAGAEPGNGSEPDTRQVAVEWLDISDLGPYRLYPAALKEFLARPREQGALYLGDVN